MFNHIVCEIIKDDQHSIFISEAEGYCRESDLIIVDQGLGTVNATFNHESEQKYIADFLSQLPVRL